MKFEEILMLNDRKRVKSIPMRNSKTLFTEKNRVPD